MADLEQAITIARDVAAALRSDTWRRSVSEALAPHAVGGGGVGDRSVTDLAEQALVNLKAMSRMEAAMLRWHVGIAARDGLAAAQDAALVFLDPATGDPVRVRGNPDGSITLWCVGPDLVDDGGIPSSDIVFLVPPSR
jgi:hypothetical protein